MKSKISYLEDKIEELLSSKNNEDYTVNDNGPMHISELQTDEEPKKTKIKTHFSRQL